MLAEHRQFILPGQKELHANIKVIPTGELEVNIQEEAHQFQAEFEELYFYTAGNSTELVCREQLGSDAVRWQLYLANEDARELAKLIELAEEEFEILMRDL
ncbi:hypothetical protein [Photobacterium atrarenae]|uniref:DUF3630 domain-containing protein n=1 Tax=Photobacterium atrarenae TaxID=865757 RepID=A0ABY5GLC3_9GAMM|nr:hypothetical protein [Photobacterium atrarenae]UTV29941.1 hypothetical protein NNL38_23375 [Photobacterium atrarenae]